jgi:hypothetical protein
VELLDYLQPRADRAVLTDDLASGVGVDRLASPRLQEVAGPRMTRVPGNLETPRMPLRIVGLDPGPYSIDVCHVIGDANPRCRRQVLGNLLAEDQDASGEADEADVQPEQQTSPEVQLKENPCQPRCLPSDQAHLLWCRNPFGCVAESIRLR